MTLDLMVPAGMPDSGDTAKTLLYIARMARDFEDFTELAPMLSKFPLEEAQLRLLYDRAWELFLEQAELEEAELPTEEPVSLEEAPDAPTEVDPELEQTIAMVLSMVLLVAGARGALVSANLLYPLVPEGYERAIDLAFRKMRPELTPVGWEPSDKPSRKRGWTRTYRVTPSL